MELLLGFAIIFTGLLGFGKCQDGVNVMKFGAIGDGKTDDSMAFLKAWKEICEKSGSQTLQIPGGKIFFLQPLIFKGPCKSIITIELQGTLSIPNPSEWKFKQKETWIIFERVEGLNIIGSGKIDGRGNPWWKMGKASVRPSSLEFSGCKNLQIKQITSMNTPRSHLSIAGCTSSTISNVNLIAPEKSPNTDGIDISRSTQINIEDSFIATGDDCVAINGGCIDINITNVNCGPGHGLSVGSLGRNGARDTVEQIRVKHCTFNGTQNGARIKTWPGGSGYAKTISYEDITLINAGYPIVIDQDYGKCDPHCPGGASAVEVSNVKFRGFHGTSIGKYAIVLNCSNVVGCNNIDLEQVNITPGPGVPTLNVLCNNVQGISRTTVPEISCLSK